MLIQIHQILAVVSILVALLMIIGCYWHMHRMEAILNLYKKDAAYKNSVSITWARRYKRERALTDALSTLLFNMIHSSTKESLRWKFMILREIEPLLHSGAYINDDSVYHWIRARLIDADKYSREKLFDEITDRIKKYYIIDLDDAEPLIDIFRKVLVTGDRVDEGLAREERIRQDLAIDYTELIRSFGSGVEMVDMDPFGDPIDRNTGMREGPPETKEEALNRLLQVAKEMGDYIAEPREEPTANKHSHEQLFDDSVYQWIRARQINKETDDKEGNTDEPGD